MPQLVRYSVAFGAFILLNLYIVPAFVRRELFGLQIFLTVALYIVVSISIGITDTWLKTYELGEYASLDDGYNEFFQKAFINTFWLFFLFAFYTTIKLGAYRMSENDEAVPDARKHIISEGLAGMIVWMAVTILIVNSFASKEFTSFWLVVIPFAISMFTWLQYRLIPNVKESGKGFGFFFGRVLLILLAAAIPIFIVCVSVLNLRAPGGLIVNLMNAAFQLCITAPAAWYLYKYRLNRRTEIFVLKKALGKSTADLDFLRSQINPHFLFNAMNTLYGTALQENAERTAEGVQKLGDMMRFMLQENVQDRILLNRETDYLKNYIGLQKLRTQASPDIRIETELDERISSLTIAPMLLIPFIENAFKHGISLRAPSHIRIVMHTKENKLYFDVINSIHTKPENDPEKMHSGIGLENVKQRLNLLYPKKHELMIRDTGREYFVHLSLELN
ncbi:MAG: histidine kinase [Mucilaginibacter polytrichastri]|nr:histidine kinase [Mucilaginibacter polytrichastri]